MRLTGHAPGVDAGGVPGLAENEASRAANPGISPCFLVFDFSVYSLAVSWLCWTFVTDLSFPFLFRVYICYDRPASCVQMLITWRLWVSIRRSWQWLDLRPEGLYGLLWGALFCSALLMVPSPIKRHQQTPTHHSVKGYPPRRLKASDPQSFDFCGRGGAYRHRRALSLTIPHALEVAIPANMTPLHVNVGATKRVYCCLVEGCHQRPLASHVAICSHVCRAHLGVKLSCPLCLQ